MSELNAFNVRLRENALVGWHLEPAQLGALLVEPLARVTLGGGAVLLHAASV